MDREVRDGGRFQRRRNSAPDSNGNCDKPRGNDHRWAVVPDGGGHRHEARSNSDCDSFADRCPDTAADPAAGGRANDRGRIAARAGTPRESEYFHRMLGKPLIPLA